MNTTIDARLLALEREVAEIKRLLRSKTGLAEPWWERIGAFEDAPVFEQAIKLGRRYRESLRPRSAGDRSQKSRRLAKKMRRGGTANEARLYVTRS